MVDNVNGIGVIQQDRSGDYPDVSAQQVARVSVRDNQISGDGASGVVPDNGDAGVFDRVSFEDNAWTGPHDFTWNDEIVDWHSHLH